MKKLLSFLLLSHIFITLLVAQNSRFTLTGRTIDSSTNEPVEQVTVQLLSLPDSSFIAGGVSLQNGQFSLSPARAGKYVVKLSFVGYQTIYQSVELVANKSQTDLGDIALSPDAILLGEAVIVAEAPPVTVKEDTTVYAASAYRVAEGAMLEELVKKLPGAEVDSEGKITINGKEIKKIMVDGKEFFSDDPKMSMKNLPANMVENVKAYDKKSDMARITGIDDGEEETVLDLTVKKGMKDGWIGNLIAGYGSEERYEAGLMMSRFMDDSSLSIVGSLNNTNNTGFSEFGDAGQGLSSGNAGSGITTARSLGLNYARDTKKLQYGGNIQYGYSSNDARRKSSTETFLQEGSAYTDAQNSSMRNRHDLRADLRFEWRVDSMTTLIFRPNASYSKTDSRNSGLSYGFNNERDSVNSKENNSTSKSNNFSFNGRLELFRKLNNKGRNFSIRANMGYSDGESDTDSYSYMRFYSYNENGKLVEDSVLDRYTNRINNNLNYQLSASYTEPVFKKHFLQLRYSFTHRKSLAQSLIYDRQLGLNDYVDDLSNKVENFYNNHNAEVSLRGIYPKMMYNVGVGFTPQSSKSETTIGPNTGPGIKQNVLNYSPSVMFRYSFSKQHVIILRYSGRSNTPNISDLQEVIDITDPLNLRYGNPNLKPSFNNNLRLFYNNYLPESMRSYSFNLFFSNTINSVVNKLTYFEETGVNEYRKTNVNGNWNARSFLSFNTPFRNRKYTLSSNTNASFGNSVSYTQMGENRGEPILSNTRDLRIGERMTGNYRSDKFDISLNASINYNLVNNDKQSKGNRETFDYYFGGNTNITLPWQLYVSTDINYRIKEGYSGDLNENELLWNAQISKNFLKNNAATIRFKIYDILREQSNLSRSISETKITDTEYNTLGSYFMVHFVYRLNTLGGKATRSSRGGNRGFEGGDRGPGGGRGGYGPPPSGGGGFR